MGPSADNRDAAAHGPVPPARRRFAPRHPVVLWGRFGAATDVEVSRLALTFDRLPEAFDGFRLAVVSDLHYGRHVEPPYARRVVEMACAEAPDLVVLCGDIVDRTSACREPLCAILAALVACAPVCAVPGNHEYYGQAERVWRRLRQTGVDVLVNRNRLIRRDRTGDDSAGGALIALAGLDDLKKSHPDFQAALSGIPKGTFTILAGHSPDLADLAPPWPRVDLMLAGHTHGGQVRLFGRALVTQTKNRAYVSGLVRAPHFPMYISRGLGTSGLPLRIGSRPELAILTLHARRTSGRA